jgi:hypothetical protein
MVDDGVDTLLRRYPESPVVQDVLGTLDPAEIRARVYALEPETDETHGACVYLRAYAARCGHALGNDVRRYSGLDAFAAGLL